MLKSAFVSLLACLAVAPATNAAVIGTTAGVDSTFDSVSNIPVSLNAFNPALGSLNSVQLLFNLTITTSTLVTNTTFIIDPLGIPIPTVLPGQAMGTTILVLSVGGFPLLSQSPSSPAFSFVIPPGTASTATTVATTVGNLSVPAFQVSSFSRLGFVPLQFFAQEIVIITPQPIGPFGAAITGTTLTRILGSVSAVYDYTPFASVPEPVSLGLLALTFLCGLALLAARGAIRNRF